MRAVFYDRQGAPQDVLQIGELPDPEPGPSEVRVRVHASTVNPSDTKGRVGYAGRKMAFPRIVPHQDGAGVIDRVGAGIDPKRVGERVWLYEANFGRPFGTAAQYTTIPAHKAVPLPDDASFEVGACLGIPGMTAHRCLFADGEVHGRAVLVQGGAGAVGTAAILLARWAGATVIATVSRPEQARVAQQAGAHVVVNRKQEDVAQRVRDATGGEGVHRVVEVDVCGNIEADLACLASGGAIACYATPAADSRLEFTYLRAMAAGAVIRGVFVYVMPEQAHHDAARDVTACLRAGAYRPVIGLRLPLDRIAEAHAAQDDGSVIGKIVLEIPA